jgi:cobalt-zinc-cadmium efflux system outer membrane protein
MVVSLHSKTPIVARFFGLWAICAPVAEARAEPPRWSADDAVAAALSSPALDAMLEASLAGARAALDEATLRPLPELELSHEQILGARDRRALEFTAGLSQTFDLTGWRGRLRGGRVHREAALRADAEGWRVETAAQARTAFFEVRYRQERLAALDAMSSRLGRGVAAISARAAQGDASEYDRLRVQRAEQIALAERVREQSLVDEAWAVLAALSPWQARPALIGELAPVQSPTERAETPLPPHLARLNLTERALASEISAGGSPWLRGWTVGAGYRAVDDAGGTGHGFVLSLALPLAFRNTEAPRVARLEAERARVAGELSLSQAVAERTAEAARTRLDAALAGLARLPELAADAELTRLAELAYGAGEATLAELLDAYASETALRLARIDLEWEARRAAIELDRRLGLGVTR